MVLRRAKLNQRKINRQMNKERKNIKENNEDKGEEWQNGEEEWKLIMVVKK